MTITFRNYNHTEDYKRVSDFLIRHHQTGKLDLHADVNQYLRRLHKGKSAKGRHRNRLA
jgi:hypothetical protein